VVLRTAPRLDGSLIERLPGTRDLIDEILSVAGVGGGHAIRVPSAGNNGAQTANHANSTSPASAALSNSVPGYATLGGRWQFAAPAGAVTDYLLFSYQVPVGYRLYVSDVDVNSMNTGAAVAVTATVLDWFLSIGDAATLADASQRRLDLGLQGFSVGAAIGAVAQDVVRSFNKVPLVIPGTKFFGIGLQVPIGTATVSQIIRGDALVNGYFESEATQ
jgi:hypothetical protein